MKKDLTQQLAKIIIESLNSDSNCRVRLSLSDEYKLLEKLKKNGIDVLKIDEFVDKLNDGEYNNHIFITISQYFSSFNPRILVLEQELADKILFLQYVPFENLINSKQTQ